MNLTNLSPALAGLAVVGLLAAGCGSSGGGSAASDSSSTGSSGSGSDSSSTGSSGGSGTTQGTVVKTASTPLGTIVVDGAGRTVYVYDQDTKGASSSACTGGCATSWPAVPASSGTPKGTGVTGTLGRITGVDGKPQLTLDGWPLYYYVGDTQAGQLTGQALDDVWWVVAPDGAKITAAPKASGSPAPADSGGGGYAY